MSFSLERIKSSRFKVGNTQTTSPILIQIRAMSNSSRGFRPSSLGINNSGKDNKIMATIRILNGNKMETPWCHRCQIHTATSSSTANMTNKWDSMEMEATMVQTILTTTSPFTTIPCNDIHRIRVDINRTETKTLEAITSKDAATNRMHSRTKPSSRWMGRGTTIKLKLLIKIKTRNQPSILITIWPIRSMSKNKNSLLCWRNLELPSPSHQISKSQIRPQLSLQIRKFLNLHRLLHQKIKHKISSMR